MLQAERVSSGALDAERDRLGVDVTRRVKKREDRENGLVTSLQATYSRRCLHCLTSALERFVYRGSASFRDFQKVCILSRTSL